MIYQIPHSASLQVMRMRHGVYMSLLEHSKGWLSLPALQTGRYRAAAKLGRDILTATRLCMYFSMGC